MATRSDAAGPARTTAAARPAGGSRARKRLQSVVRAVEAYLAGHGPVSGQGLGPAPRPGPGLGPVPAAPAPRPLEARWLAGLDRATVSLPGSEPSEPTWPRPRPLDKPFTVAHYQAMAQQVAYERQVSELDGRGAPTSPGAYGTRPPSYAWSLPSARLIGGAVRHG